jgi:hypothetical protein
MLEHIPGLPDLILFWMNDVSVIRVSRCGITRDTLSSKHVLTLIWMIMTGGSFKIISNWAVLTVQPAVAAAGDGRVNGGGRGSGPLGLRFRTQLLLAKCRRRA